MTEAEVIINDIKRKILKPIYFLMGDEPFFIDEIAKSIEKNVLDESEKGFNQQVMYGRDVTIEEIVSAAKRYPMMADKQVIIVKEAQDLSRNIEKLVSYAENPQPTTLLVFCYKYKSLDKRKKLGKVIAKNGVLFESKKLYENKVSGWIQHELGVKNYKIEPKASLMLVEFLGTDLSKISNELNKLTSNLPSGSTINDNHIEENIGISKDFNNFELRKSISEKNILKANRIINYFSENPKNNPIVVTISLLNNLFTQLLFFHGLKDKSKKNVASALGINPYFTDEYFLAARNYPIQKVTSIISFLREADVKSKGVEANQSQQDILKELVFKIMH